MTTASGAPDIGNIVDDFLNPIKQAFGAFVEKGEATLKTDAQGVLTEVSSALDNASTAVSTAQAKAEAVINPIVNGGITAAGTAISVAYPPFAALIAASESEVENLADEGTDAIIIGMINAAAKLLSEAGKSTAAVTLSNLAGAT